MCKRWSLAPAIFEVMVLTCSEEVKNMGAKIWRLSLAHLYNQVATLRDQDLRHSGSFSLWVLSLLSPGEGVLNCIEGASFP